VSTKIEKLTIVLAKTLFQNDKQKAALIHAGQNRRYFTGFPSSEGALFVTADEAFLLMDFRYAEAASKQAKNCKVIEIISFAQTIELLVKETGVKQVYLEEETLTLGYARRFEEAVKKGGGEVVKSGELDKAIGKLRMIKTPEEVKKIEAAQAITDAAFSHILPYIKEGITEKEIAFEIEFFMKKQGADGSAFEPIIAAGANGSMCHAVPSDYKIKKGDLITMDTGALLDGYNSDMTRTVALGSVSEKQKIVYNKVLEAHMAVIDGVKPGMPCCAADKIARDIIEADYAGRFGHGLGHGVGLEIHEEPRFSRLDNTPCEAGMVVTNEPGIYLPDEFGVRIEDMLLITEDGCRTLTKSPKELIIL
jgi:Xaa-Pro aminopeptidase